MLDLKTPLDKMVKTIGQKNTYHGNRISDSIMRMIEVEMRISGAGVLAPYWLGVMERGRGPRKSAKDHNLAAKIFAWMRKRNMFRSRTPEGQLAEAKSMTWYINKYGNQHFRSKQFVDIYKSAREQCVMDVTEEYGREISKITQDIL